ncbi:phage tail protein [Paraburkholderia sp. G-4-1-8]|uniref:Phage tail protein n=2 Tax=Paraburkholderia antibiotica TaxID=2728839 RepID=A0A7Y0A1W9_9BURK|nr:phage tail protein [Paraburkholderia antibiotica]
MSVTAASASATLTADEIVVGSALGGLKYTLASFNKTITLTTPGAGGMDTGSAPASGYVALYAIYNPSTATAALLATNATSAIAPNVYGGANMPAGYTASALLSVVPTTSGGLFSVVLVQDRKTNILQYTALNSSTTSTIAATSLSIAGGVPKNAKRVGGSLSLSNTTSSNSTWAFYATSSGTGVQQFSVNTTGSGGNLFGYSTLDLSSQQTLTYALLSITAGTCAFIVYISSYEI